MTECELLRAVLDSETEGAVEEVVWLRAVLGRIAAGHAHPSRLASEAVAESAMRFPGLLRDAR